MSAGHVTTRARAFAALAALPLAVALLTGCGESEPTPVDDTEDTSSVLDDPAPAEDEPIEQTEDPEVAEFLLNAGIDDVMLKRVANVAETNNYAAAIPMTPDGVQMLALRLVDVCREIAAGDWTYEGHEADDISNGGTPAQAGAMRRFMEGTFCPAVKPEK
ncbi:hypothetical protein [Streptomyces sp. NPDC051219]|uniref:hypothetical protein n=1 Tax=Streptomyces sp. NPDC051219 TaxID=3155283 RepID=UPI00343AFB85